MTGPSEVDILRDMIMQQGKQIEGLTRVISNAVNPEPAPVEYSDEQLRENPSLVLRAIREENAKLVAPLNEMKLANERATAYKNMRDSMKAKNPKLAHIWDRVIRPGLDITFESGKFDINPEIVQYQINALAGAHLTEHPEDAVPKKNEDELPLNLPPSGAPAPSGENKEKVKVRPLTENEEVIRKLRKQTVEDFLAGLQNDQPLSITRIKPQ